jgi:transposase
MIGCRAVRGNSILTFLYHPEVSPDNNGSERAIRNIKVKTKVSGRFRNKNGKGANRFARIRSVIDTAIKNRQEVCPALSCLAKVWIHPLIFDLSSYNFLLS